MSNQNEFKTIFITGASRGIGLEFVSQVLASKKVEKIFATVRSKSDKLELIKQKYPNQLEIIYSVEVSDLESVKKAFDIVKKHTNSIDLLINNAGIIGTNVNSSILDLKNSEYLEIFNTNVIGVINVTNTFFPLFNKESKTLVINVSSILSSISSVETTTNSSIYTPYKVSKSALNMLTKNYSLEFGSKATFVILHPGWLDTDMGNSGGLKPPQTVEDGVQHIIQQVYTLKEDKNGHFINNEGVELPW
eukprot:TRINITY_DN5203_c0_g1_i1.p1 TRINITY_DN5203_c0_g1~~TRINITY_DN5203_c0_g1_i1.p1  ORF type:complete len:248 (+),score=52.99 TRINITY_DN5203_c0_g1_i1:49-792(+)